MIIKLSKIISCTSQHPSYPATNLFQYASSREFSTWLCAKPGILESEVIFELSEPAPVTGVDIGNSRCCSVRITGSTKSEPENWVTIIEHEFMSRNDAEDGKFKDQVQLFTRKEMREETLKIIFSRIKVTCMQPANTKVLFGLSFLILRTEDKSDSENLDAFGRFKVKQNKDDSLDEFREKYLQHIRPKQTNFKTDIAQQIAQNRAMTNKEIRDVPTTRKRPSLNLTTASPEPETPYKRIKMGDKDTKESSSEIQNSSDSAKRIENLSESEISSSKSFKKEEKDIPSQVLSKDTKRVKPRCSLCLGNEENVLCKTCNLLKPEEAMGSEESGRRRPKPKPKAKPVKKADKDFNKFFEGIAFSLSGYINPQRDDIRRKALAMGAKYIVNTNRRNHGCTHLVCAFKNTPKYNQLKGSVKIVSHQWIEECYNKKTRFPWRRYALDSDDKAEPESEEEVMASSGPPQPTSIYDQDTDSDD